MPTLANNIGVAYQLSLFAVLEATKGTLVFPQSSGIEACVPAGFPEMSQNPSFVNSDEVVYSRDVLAKFQNVTPAGTFTLPIYIRPSGTAGTAPMGDNLLLSLFGKKTVVGGTSVTYAQQVVKPSLSLWFQRGHTIFNAAGAVVDAMKMSFTTKGGALATLSGQFLKMGYAGTSQLTAIAATAATAITVDDGTKYTVGSVIQNTSANTGAGDHGVGSAGYTVTAVTGNVLTISPGIVAAAGWSVGDTICGYLPVGTPAGSALSFRQSLFTVEGTSRNLKGLDFNYSDSVKILDDEITSSGYPVDYLESARQIDGSLHCYLRRNDIGLITQGMNMNKGALVAQIGSTAGSIATINVPKAVYEVPQLKTAAPAVEFDLKYTAISNSGQGEDSCTLAFT